MGALPRPQLPPGPRRELLDALHGLHHRAGWPSLRTLARESGVSHTTVSKILSGPALPQWGALEVVVEAMDGDVPHFHELWLAASDPVAGERTERARRIAGRHAELAAVRHHLDAGSGLLLVAGEAGIGKTELVTTAGSRSSSLVAVGHCRALSGGVTLLPIADALRRMLQEQPEDVHEALSSCPAYVSSAMSVLLPELDASTAPASAPEFARHHLFSAIAALLQALRRRRPVAMLVEDGHWADPATLDLLEMLRDEAPEVPVTVTWRVEDPDTTDDRARWFERSSRRAGVVLLAPLSLQETAEQLTLLGRPMDPADVERLFTRTGGVPLFTEQLSLTADGASLPRLLDDVLARRFRELDGDSWAVARTLAVADRPLTHHELCRATTPGLDATGALRVLVDRRLLSDDKRLIRLRHPLMAEGIRATLTPGEAHDDHRRVAEVLAQRPDPPSAEIADHWQAAEAPDTEMRWRVQAALDASARWAKRESFAAWLRVLELLRHGVPLPRDARISVGQAFAHTLDSAVLIEEPSGTKGLATEALTHDLPPMERASILRRLGDLECTLGDFASGLERLDEALDLLDDLGPSEEEIHVLQTRAFALMDICRWEEAAADIDLALHRASAMKATDARRSLLRVGALATAGLGRGEEARRMIDEAWATGLSVVNPMGDILLATDATDVLLAVGASAAEIEAAAAPGFAAAERWELDAIATSTLRFNVVLANLRAGATARAEELIEHYRDRPLTSVLHNGHVALAMVDLRRGRTQEALTRLRALESMTHSLTRDGVEDHTVLADVEIWAGLPGEAFTRLHSILAFVLDPGAARTGAATLVCLARAAADHLPPRAIDERREVAVDLRRSVRQAALDPFGPQATGADVAANTAHWRAELGRLERTDEAADWVRAATAWDGLGRPHDAAYCRWRAAQAAIRNGHGTLGARLLKRAARDGRDHVPLAAAIAGDS